MTSACRTQPSPFGRRHSRRRRGATTVEFALVCSVFFLFLFGVFEYCRYLLLLQTCTNAARDAARYASVNVNNLDPYFTGSQFTDPGYPIQGDGGYGSSRPVFTVPAIKDYALAKMGGVQNMINPVTPGAEIIQVYPCDPTTLYTDPPGFAPRVQPQTIGGVVQPAVWNRAQFTERIAVRVTGTYTPVLPTFLKMDTISRVNIVAVMGSEG